MMQMMIYNIIHIMYFIDEKCQRKNINNPSHVLTHIPNIF